MTARTAEASTVPQPRGKPGGPGLFHIPGEELPPYIQHVRDELIKKGRPESQATQMAIGIVRDWAHGHNRGHKVSADVQAAAAKAIAQYDASRAKAKAIPNKGGRRDMSRTEDLSIWDPNKHPRGGKGSPQGGKFVPIGTARNSSAKAAQKSKVGKETYGHEIVASAPVQATRLQRLSDAQLAALTKTAYSFKSSDPNVVKLRLAVAAEMAKRGYDVKDFGALGGGINSDKKLPTGKAAVKKTKTSPRKRRSAARSKAATSKAVNMSNTQTDLATLTSKQRNNLPPSQFALPGQKYPIPDINHARAALSRVAQHGTPEEQAAVRKAVLAKFPQLAKKKAAA